MGDVSRDFVGLDLGLGDIVDERMANDPGFGRVGQHRVRLLPQREGFLVLRRFELGFAVFVQRLGLANVVVTGFDRRDDRSECGRGWNRWQCDGGQCNTEDKTQDRLRHARTIANALPIACTPNRPACAMTRPSVRPLTWSGSGFLRAGLALAPVRLRERVEGRSRANPADLFSCERMGDVEVVLAAVRVPKAHM